MVLWHQIGSLAVWGTAKLAATPREASSSWEAVAADRSEAHMADGRLASQAS